MCRPILSLVESRQVYGKHVMHSLPPSLPSFLPSFLPPSPSPSLPSSITPSLPPSLSSEELPCSCWQCFVVKWEDNKDIDSLSPWDMEPLPGDQPEGRSEAGDADTGNQDHSEGTLYLKVHVHVCLLSFVRTCLNVLH